MPNPMGKTRPADNPYLTVTDGTFTHKVLKAYSADPDKPYARWFCDVSSPMTHGGSDLGDTYIATVTGRIIQRDPVVPDSALPRHLLDPSLPAPRDPLADLFGS
jgi:hypothetical protein